MRWTKARVILFAAVVVAVAGAAVHVGALTNDATLSSDRSTVLYPSVITLTADVASVTADTPSQATFEVKTLDVGSVWVPVGTVAAKPGAPGHFVAFSAPNPRSADYRARIGEIETAPVRVLVEVPMGKPVASKAVVKAGKTIGLSGTIRPFHPTSAVIRLDFQRRGSTAWPSVSTSTTVAPTVVINNDKSEWVTSITPTKAGKWRVRSFHECPGHVASYSAWTYYTVVK